MKTENSSYDRRNCLGFTSTSMTYVWVRRTVNTGYWKGRIKVVCRANCCLENFCLLCENTIANLSLHTADSSKSEFVRNMWPQAWQYLPPKFSPNAWSFIKPFPEKCWEETLSLSSPQRWRDLLRTLRKLLVKSKTPCEIKQSGNIICQPYDPEWMLTSIHLG